MGMFCAFEAKPSHDRSNSQFVSIAVCRNTYQEWADPAFAKTKSVMALHRSTPSPAEPATVELQEYLVVHMLDGVMDALLELTQFAVVVNASLSCFKIVLFVPKGVPVAVMA